MFFLLIACLIALILILPYLRILIKRIALYFKLRALCRRQGLLLHTAHPLWLFAGRNGSCYDFYLEGEDTVLAVKLFPVKSKASTLVFLHHDAYMIRRPIALVSNVGLIHIMPIDSRVHKLPKYEISTKEDFRYRKTVRKVLLVHPICNEIRCEYGGKRLLCTGDTVGDMTLCSFFHLNALIAPNERK